MLNNVLTKFSLRTVITATVVFMSLNALLPLNFSLQAEVVEYPFKLIMTLDKSSYRQGERVFVTWTLINLGEENITLYISRDFFDFIVYDVNFVHVFQWGADTVYPGLIIALPPVPPGGNMTWPGFWNQIYDGSRFVNFALWHTKVPPGTYLVEGLFSSLTYSATLKTPVIRITVTG